MFVCFVCLGGGFYCGKLYKPDGTMIYVFNGFFMAMRQKFVAEGTSIYYYLVEWDPKKLSWAEFRGAVLGPTDPATAPADSLRRVIYDKWEFLGLQAQPNVGDNGVHASASPFEALAEKTNWLGVAVADDAFGAALLDAGVSAKTIEVRVVSRARQRNLLMLIMLFLFLLLFFFFSLALVCIELER